MVIVEESTNYPTILGRKNIPIEKRWGAGRQIASLPSVIAAGMDRSFLPQRLISGPRLLRARKGIRGDELSLHTESDVLSKNIQFNHQLTKYPIIPLLDRPHPVFDKIKAQATVVPRTKLIGVFGIIDPTEWPPKGATEKNVPQPWGPREWIPGADVGRLPSVIQTGGGVPGPSRTMHPKEMSIVV